MSSWMTEKGCTVADALAPAHKSTTSVKTELKDLSSEDEARVHSGARQVGLCVWRVSPFLHGAAGMKPYFIPRTLC